jgi:hypothetical protein
MFLSMNCLIHNVITHVPHFPSINHWTWYYIVISIVFYHCPYIHPTANYLYGPRTSTLGRRSPSVFSSCFPLSVLSRRGRGRGLYEFITLGLSMYVCMYIGVYKHNKQPYPKPTLHSLHYTVYTVYTTRQLYSLSRISTFNTNTTQHHPPILLPRDKKRQITANHIKTQK